MVVLQTDLLILKVGFVIPTWSTVLKVKTRTRYMFNFIKTYLLCGAC